MKQNGKIFLSLTLFLTLTTAGCYTQLMTPQEFTQVRREQLTSVHADESYSLNFQQSCVSCHSRAELEDRYIDQQYYGVMVVHGIRLDPIAWSGSDYYSPYDEVYFAPRTDLITPWWLPPAVTVQGSGATQGQPGGRIRVTGTTRDNGTGREPVQASPVVPPASGGTNAATPPPAVTTTPTNAATPTTGTERTRSDSGGTTGNRTRTDSPTRDEGNRPR